jgi:hypothetical protein
MLTTGRWGGRASTKAGARDLAMDAALAMDPAGGGRCGGRAAGWHMPEMDDEAQDIDPSKVWELYRRPGTEGERLAAKEALKRMGAWTEQPEPKPEPRPEPKPRPQPAPRQSGPKRYRVVLQYTWNGQTLHTPEMPIEASDEIAAEAKARQHAKETWRTTNGSKPPEFKHYKTTRI